MFRTYPLLSAVILSLAAVPAAAQPLGTPAERAANARAEAALHARIAQLEARVGEARASGALSRGRATALRRELDRTRRTATRLSRQQGFVSAAEFASFDRTIAMVTRELDRTGRSYGDDALPSAEMLAFRRMDARLRYRESRIDHDERGCAVYRGIAPDGRVRRERLSTPAGRPICTGD